MIQELEKEIYRILSGKFLFSYKEKKYVLLYPKPLLKYKANLIYESIIHDEKYNEWIRAENLDRYMQYIGVWDNEMSNFMNQYEKQIENLKVSLFSNRLNNRLTNKTRSQLSNLRSQANSLHQIRQVYFDQTLEGYAESIKHEFIIINTVFHKKKKVFDKFRSFNNLSDSFNGIVTEINKNIIGADEYRKIARSDLWRSFWNVSKVNVFSGPVSDWTDEQRTLVSYSIMYDGVYDHPERPPDVVIEDDDMLDGWMISQKREIEKSKKQDQILKTNSKLDKAQEVFIFTDSQEGIQEIMSMNSSEALLDIAQREHAIKKSTTIDHINLPDIQKEIKR